MTYSLLKSWRSWNFNNASMRIKKKKLIFEPLFFTCSNHIAAKILHFFNSLLTPGEYVILLDIKDNFWPLQTYSLFRQIKIICTWKGYVYLLMFIVFWLLIRCRWVQKEGRSEIHETIRQEFMASELCIDPWRIWIHCS